jgi:hypothetical protein
MLTLVRTLHTLIWLVMTTAVFYIGYGVISMRFNSLFYVALFLISAEIIIIVANSWKCPLTGIARRHTSDDAPNFDIFLPKVVARYNKEIFTAILLIILGIYLKNVLS